MLVRVVLQSHSTSDSHHLDGAIAQAERQIDKPIGVLRKEYEMELRLDLHASLLPRFSLY